MKNVLTLLWVFGCGGFIYLFLKGKKGEWHSPTFVEGIGIAPCIILPIVLVQTCHIKWVAHAVASIVIWVISFIITGDGYLEIHDMRLDGNEGTAVVLGGSIIIFIIFSVFLRNSRVYPLNLKDLE